MRRPPHVLIIGEFGPGALALYYERAFAALGWRSSRYDMWRHYARHGLLRKYRILRRLLRRPLWALMALEVISLARHDLPDLVWCTKAPFLGREATKELKRRSRAPIVMVYPDSPYGAYTQRADVLSVLSEFDRVCIWGRHLVEPLRADGVGSVMYFPFAFDPSDYGPQGPAATPSCGRRHAAVFVGQHNHKRETWLAALGGLDLGVWGLGWKHAEIRGAGDVCVHEESVRGAGVAAIYRGATIALNILNPENVPAHNMRTFEIPPCRTLMLSEHTDEIGEFFRPGQDCLTASTSDEFRAHAERVLARPDLARAIAYSGWQAAQPYTYEARLRPLLESLGMGPR
jgi:spore maturation protein CgeB